MKKSLADRIEQYLKVLIDRSEENQIEIQRAELAETFDCVPSQVTYVLSTRFTEEEGYYTQSRRGGKGYVRITRCFKQEEYSLNDKQMFNWLEELIESNLLTNSEAYLVKHILLHGVNRIPIEYRNSLRAGIVDAVKSYCINKTR
ncbi:MAG: CtsR family transcriptional regulator [Syntrophomonadaceae bacterium]